MLLLYFILLVVVYTVLIAIVNSYLDTKDYGYITKKAILGGASGVGFAACVYAWALLTRRHFAKQIEEFNRSNNRSIYTEQPLMSAQLE